MIRRLERDLELPPVPGKILVLRNINTPEIKREQEDRIGFLKLIGESRGRLHKATAIGAVGLGLFVSVPHVVIVALFVAGATEVGHRFLSVRHKQIQQRLTSTEKGIEYYARLARNNPQGYKRLVAHNLI